jgi:Ca2+-transporting ATPase
LVIAGVTLGAFMVALKRSEPAHAVSVAFVTLALAQAFHLGNARSTSPVWTARHATSNRWALGAVLLVVALQLAAVYTPAFSELLNVVPLTLEEWGIALAAAAIPAVLGQTIKVVQSR